MFQNAQSAHVTQGASRHTQPGLDWQVARSVWAQVWAPTPSGPHGREHEVALVFAGQLACSVRPTGQTAAPVAPPVEPSGGT